jgi:hypothetical protein
MNRDEAKYILRSFHLNGLDTDDPQFQAALEMIQHDPELREWFSTEQVLDQKLSDAFRAFPVPPALQRELLAARNVVPPAAWWRQPVWMSVAASLALLGVLSVLLSRTAHKRPFAEFHSYIIETAAQLDHLDIRTGDLAQVREWLRAHRAPDDFAIPGRLHGKSSVGCRVFSWNEQNISLLCFDIENNKVAHLFVMDRSVLTNWPEGGVPQIETAGNGIATAAWSDSKRIYIMALEQGERDLRRLLL